MSQYFVVEIAGGISNKTLVWFLVESTNDDAKKKLHWCFSFQLRKLIYQFPQHDF